MSQGRRSFVEQFIPQRESSTLFGGYVVSEDSSGEEFLGVWSPKRGKGNPRTGKGKPGAGKQNPRAGIQNPRPGPE